MSSYVYGFDQVKFTRILRCDPLFENEFCDAIRDNYFTKYKFNLGLSEDQVCSFSTFGWTLLHNLLYLETYAGACVNNLHDT